jgi:lipoprotein-releasing system ATP-binding protein
VNELPLIALRDIECVRTEANLQTRVDVAVFTLEAASVTLLTGEVGCGKNLLLRLLGLLERPDSGEVLFEGQPTAQMTDDARVTLRSRKCGYVFASPFLLSNFTVLENIAMPMFKICQMDPAATRDRTEDLMEFTGLGHVATEHQVAPALQFRAAFARALANDPVAIFIENLDTLLPPEELGPFRDLLHRATLRYRVAVVATAMPGCAIHQAERRVCLDQGRVTQEVAP